VALAAAGGGCGSDVAYPPGWEAGSGGGGGKDGGARPDGGARDGAAGDGSVDAAADWVPPTDCPLGPGDESTELRCTGLYADWDTKTLAPGVRPYDPGLHLWSDGAVKTRWIYLPPGTQIDTSNMDEWSFPYGTKLWKEFVVGGVRLETRMLWKRPADQIGGWYLTTYRWSPDGARADELLTGELDADGNGYEIPSQSLCAQCHGGRRDQVMGFEAVSLSSPAAGGLTMTALVAGGLLTAPPASPLTIPGDGATSAALGYLHANCGIACHNPGAGAASTTGFFMRLDVATLGSVQSTGAWRTGMNAASYFTLPGVGQTKIFVPCSPDASVAYYRMSVRDGVDGVFVGSQMPPIATHQIDPTGLAIVAAWLTDQPQCATAAP